MAPGAAVEGGATSSQPEVALRRLGRRPATSRADIEHEALRLFDARGFEATTVDDIAVAAGISRRTFFRYFPSKNDVPWGDFASGLERMREGLEATPASVPLMTALTRAVLQFNRFDPGEIEWHRRRMRLLLTVPALQAHSSLKYRAWRDVVAEFAARRSGERPDSLLPRTLGYAALGAALAAYESWLDADGADGADLEDLLARALLELGDGFAEIEPTPQLE